MVAAAYRLTFRFQTHSRWIYPRTGEAIDGRKLHPTKPQGQYLVGNIVSDAPHLASHQLPGVDVIQQIEQMGKTISKTTRVAGLLIVGESFHWVAISSPAEAVEKKKPIFDESGDYVQKRRQGSSGGNRSDCQGAFGGELDKTPQISDVAWRCHVGGGAAQAV
jgi:hypothetical protein